ncbi:MAG: TldD/PmbA family protein [Euzebyales bacterium]|nr:TldD/PmbA family protein [Euzebyales bacterium]
MSAGAPAAGGGRGSRAPFDERWLARLAEVALETAARAAPDGVAIEVRVDRTVEGLTRFANSQVHQNTWSEDLAVAVRAVTDDGRVGVATIHTDDEAGAAEAAARAAALARVAPPDPAFPGLAPAADVPTVPVDEATAAADPRDRADAVRSVLTEVPDAYEAAGAYATTALERLIVTTAGQHAYVPMSTADLTLGVTGPSSSGFAQDGGRSAAEVDPAAAGRRAAAKALAGTEPVDTAAGDWTVVLEPGAVGTLLVYLGFIGFGARTVAEGRSFASGRLGERVMDQRVTLIDDATGPQGIGAPFDFEGTPARRTGLVADGVLRGVVHDRASAAAAHTSSTGNALPAPNPHGPIPLNLQLLPGDGGSADDLVAGCERGLLITRLHYVNALRPAETLVTGMTRDGTFLIEDGKVVAPVRNLRFTQSIVDTLARIEAVGSEIGYCPLPRLAGGNRQPAVRASGFSFTGTTTFG